MVLDDMDLHVARQEGGRVSAGCDARQGRTEEDLGLEVRSAVEATAPVGRPIDGDRRSTGDRTGRGTADAGDDRCHRRVGNIVVGSRIRSLICARPSRSRHGDEVVDARGHWRNRDLQRAVRVVGSAAAHRVRCHRGWHDHPLTLVGRSGRHVRRGRGRPPGRAWGRSPGRSSRSHRGRIRSRRWSSEWGFRCW